MAQISLGLGLQREGAATLLVESLGLYIIVRVRNSPISGHEWGA